MISLLLTLFISVFSCCSTVNQLEGHKENTVVVKSLYNQDDYTYMGIGDMVSYDFFDSFIENAKQYQFIYNTGVEVSDFYHGVDILISFNNTDDIAFGALNNFTFNSYIYSISTLYLSCDSSHSSYDVFTVDFVFTNSSARGFDAYFYYSDDSKTLCIANNVYLHNDSGFTNETIKFNTYSFRSLFPSTLHYSSDEAYKVGYDTGYGGGYTTGYNVGYGNGRQAGIQEGLNMLDDYSTTANTVFEGIFDVGLLPVNVFLTIFNFELFGVNIAGVVSGLLTLSVVIIIIRLLLGGKKDD